MQFIAHKSKPKEWLVLNKALNPKGNFIPDPFIHHWIDLKFCTKLAQIFALLKGANALFNKPRIYKIRIIGHDFKRRPPSL